MTEEFRVEVELDDSEHGYTLGEWADEWNTYAQRAVKGDWEKSGKETFARRRGGLTPETPVRDADPKKD